MKYYRQVINRRKTESIAAPRVPYLQAALFVIWNFLKVESFALIKSELHVTDYIFFFLCTLSDQQLKNQLGQLLTQIIQEINK